MVVNTLISKIAGLMIPMLSRTVYSSLVFVSVLFAYGAPPTANVVEQIIVAINGEPYTLSNFKEYARIQVGREFPTGDLNKIGKEDKEVLEQFITEKLLAAEVKLTGIKVSEEEIDRYIARIKERNRITDEELAAALSRDGVTMEKYRESIRTEIEKSEIINRQVRKRVNITPEDVERYYRSNAKKYMSPERAWLRHILLSLPERAAPEREKEVMERAAGIRKRIITGEDFAKLARDYSEGAGASAGGDIGWVKRGSLIREIEDLAFNKLSAGEISPPLRTSLGVHLVKLEAKERGQLLPLSEVQEKIREELLGRATEERFQKWLKTDLRKRHRVDVKLPGVVFRPEETKEATVDSLMASAARTSGTERSSWLSYLNPLSYIVSETPIDEKDPYGPNIVSLFGVPLFKSESAEDVPEDILPPLDATDSSDKKPQESGGFFSSIWKSLNPFSSRP